MDNRRKAKSTKALYQRFLKENGVTPESAMGNVLMKWAEYLNEHQDDLREGTNTFPSTHLLCNSTNGDEVEGVLITISTDFHSRDYGNHTLKLTQFLEKRHSYNRGHYNWVLLDQHDNIVMSDKTSDDEHYTKEPPAVADFALLETIYCANMQYCYYGDIPIAIDKN